MIARHWSGYVTVVVTACDWQHVLAQLESLVAANGAARCTTAAECC